MFPRPFRILIAMMLSLGSIAAATAPWDAHGALRADGHLIRHADHTPFFWLGDTAWGMCHQLSRSQVDSYLDNRRAKGFNVIQTVALAHPGFSGSTLPVNPANHYGHRAFHGGDSPDLSRPLVVDGGSPTSPNDYWDHVDYIVDAAAARGLYVGLLPQWGYTYNARFNTTNAKSYGRFLGQRYRSRKNVIWIIGGDDIPPDSSHVAKYRSMAEGVLTGVTGATLAYNQSGSAWNSVFMTFHPGTGSTGYSSSQWFHHDRWLDTNMYQHGGRLPKAYDLGVTDYNLSPVKPTVNGEGTYEDATRWGSGAVADAWKVRRQAYHSLTAGAIGHTYGHNLIWDFRSGWETAMNRPGAYDMTVLKNFWTARPWTTYVPDAGIIASGAFDGSVDGGDDRKTAVRSTKGSECLVYFAVNTAASIRLDRITTSSSVSATWMDPRSGSTQSAGTHATSAVPSFTPPSGWQDAVLLIQASGDTSDQAPEVAFTTPTQGATLSGSVSPNATAYDPDIGTDDGDGVDHVVFELLQGGSTIASKRENYAPYDWAGLDTTAYPDGDYTLRATVTATSAAGGGSSSSSIAVGIDNANDGPPAIPPEAAYQPDAATLALYHFDETSGTIANHGATGSTLDLTNTGGSGGRGGGGGGHGATAAPGFGHAFDILDSGDGSYNTSTDASISAVSGGLLTSGSVRQSMLQGADGAFTFEALVNLPEIDREQQILARDGSGSDRGILFRVSQGQVNFYTGASELGVTIPSTGAHAFAPGVWFHVAIAYTGQGGASGNLAYYWTRVDAGAQEANRIGTATIQDLDPDASPGNTFGIGTTTRQPFRFQAHLIDEVRISGIARRAEQFIFPLAEPSAPTLGSIQINFQPAGAPSVDGWLVDAGASFGDRGAGRSYGWSTTTDETRDRNLIGDQLEDTLNHMQKSGRPSWELALPNGDYLVSLVCGDPGYTNQVNHLQVEGVAVRDLDGQDHFDRYDAIPVTVSDGRLTVQAASDGINAKINWIQVNSAATISN